MSGKEQFILIVSLCLIFCDFIQVGAENKARYDNYRLYRFHLKTEEQVKIFQEIEAESDSYDFIGHAREPGQNLTIVVSAAKIAEIHDIMERFNVEATILDYNLQHKIDLQEETVMPATTPGSEIDWTHYYHLSTIYDWMDFLAKKYDFVKTFEIGKSYEGVPIRGVYLSKKSGNTGVFVEGGIHSREWISPTTATFILHNLLTSDDEDVKDLAENFDWYIVPTVNPDGYKYTFEKDRWWRKNLKPYGRTRGVDLNRNFDSNWGGVGSSTNPGSFDFSGAHAFSEPEANVLAAFISKKENIKTYIALHSYSQLLMFPYGHTNEKVKNYEDLKQICLKAVGKMAQVHGKTYLSGSKMETIYPSSGGSIDWAYTAGVPISLTFELRGTPDSTDMFILPANEIIPTGEETLAAFVTILKEARDRGYYQNRIL